LRANAKKYNVDPNHIGAWGASAGAIMAQWLGTMRHSDGFPKVGGYEDQDDSVQCVVSFFGTGDWTLGYRIGKISSLIKNAEALHGCTYKENPEKWKKDSAITYVRAGDPPFFMVQGELDKAACFEEGQVMADALEKVGVPHELIISKNAGHMFNHPPNGPAPDPTPLECRKRAIAFANKYLKGGAPDTGKDDESGAE
jgi:dipeptidyl aminopeptidase/acylaminoacyl peptidase